MKYSLLKNKYPKGSIIYKIINNVWEYQFRCIFTSNVLTQGTSSFYPRIEESEIYNFNHNLTQEAIPSFQLAMRNFHVEQKGWKMVLGEQVGGNLGYYSTKGPQSSILPYKI